MKPQSAKNKDKISKAEALKRGLPRYFTGIPCKNGHVAERITNGSRCTVCISSDRKCPKCNRIKKAHLFNKNQVWCRACSKKRSVEFKANLKITDFAKWKSYQLRGNWLRRADSLNVNRDEVPTRKDIEKWISTLKFECYFTGEKLNNDNIGFDHLIPISRGGSFMLDNIVLTSLKINAAKGDMSEDEFNSLLNCISSWEDGGNRLLKRLQVSNSMFSRKRR